MIKNIFYATFLVLIGCNSPKTVLSDAVIMEIPAYHIENDSSVLKSILKSKINYSAKTLANI